MEFGNRIKKEMTEGMIRALLEDAGYRVIDSGIEKVIRELSCMTTLDYLRLGYPDALSHLPDFTVMNREQTEKFLVEVKYRSVWDKSLFDSVAEQVRIFGEIVLVSVNASAENPQNIHSPSRFLRCCRLRHQNGLYEIELRSKDKKYQWKPVDGLSDGSWLWWSMSPLQERFTQLSEDKNSKSLTSAINALTGILDG
ncbi:hypothetical protein DYQ93_20305 [Xanthomonas sp. LMG 8992]|nr:hypothetical protein [Xanthomonas sp. LMG 8992]